MVLQPVGRDQTVDRFSAVTGADGKFRIALPEGDYHGLKAERTGYFDPGAFNRRSIHLSSDERTSVKLELIPTGAITGRVLDSSGEPMEGVTVSAAEDMGPGRTVSTDDRGVFRISSLLPGKYRVFARIPQSNVPPEIRTDGSAEAHYSTTYYPNVLNNEAASRVQVLAGAETAGIDIHLVQTPIVRVSGKVTGVPPGEKSVHLLMNDISVGVRPDGTFEIWRVDPGKRILRASCDCSGKPMFSGPVEIDVGNNDVDNIELRVMPPFELQGKLEYDDEDARPKSPGQPNGQTEPSAPQRGSNHLSLGSVLGFGGADGTIEGDSFHFAQVEPGLYKLMLFGPVFVRSIQYGDATISGSQIDLRSAVTAPLTIHLASATGTISGIVQDENGPVANVRVQLTESIGSGMRTIGVVTTKDDGRFTMPNVPPGKYRLVAVMEADLGVFFAGGPDTFEELGEVIEIGDHESIDKDLKLGKLAQ